MITTNLAPDIFRLGYSDIDTNSFEENSHEDYIFNPAKQLSSRILEKTYLREDQQNSSEYFIKLENIDFDPLIPKIPKIESFKSTFTPLQEWEGYVVEIGNDFFTARLIDITAESENEEEEADFPISDLSDSDKKLLKVGAIFRWAIGYRKSFSGNKQRISSIIFRRLPKWTNREKEENRKKAELLAASLHGD